MMHLRPLLKRLLKLTKAKKLIWEKISTDGYRTVMGEFEIEIDMCYSSYRGNLIVNMGKLFMFQYEIAHDESPGPGSTLYFSSLLLEEIKSQMPFDMIEVNIFWDMLNAL